MPVMTPHSAVGVSVATFTAQAERGGGNAVSDVNTLSEGESGVKGRSTYAARAVAFVMVRTLPFSMPRAEAISS